MKKRKSLTAIVGVSLLTVFSLSLMLLVSPVIEHYKQASDQFYFRKNIENYFEILHFKNSSLAIKYSADVPLKVESVVLGKIRCSFNPNVEITSQSYEISLENCLTSGDVDSGEEVSVFVYTNLGLIRETEVYVE